jgi:hypothetical protein
VGRGRARRPPRSSLSPPSLPAASAVRARGG